MKTFLNLALLALSFLPGLYVWYKAYRARKRAEALLKLEMHVTLIDQIFYRLFDVDQKTCWTHPRTIRLAQKLQELRGLEAKISGGKSRELPGWARTITAQ